MSGINLVLGAESSHCIPVCTKVIRPGGDSTLLETPHGMLVEGNLNVLLEDLDVLLNAQEGNISCNNDSDCYDCLDLPDSKEIHSNLVIFDEDGFIDNRDLLKATDKALEYQCSEYLNCKDLMVDECETELNKQLTKFVFDNTKRLDDGRLQMPLLWNGKVDHLLGRNFNLAKAIVFCIFVRTSIFHNWNINN